MTDEAPHRLDERQQEEREFVSVIIKRNDQARRHPDDTLELAVTEGAAQFTRTTRSLFLSAIAAGAILAFTTLAVGVVSTLMPGEEGFGARLALGALYPIGFVLCILSGTQLFTEHTALAVYPVLDRRTSVLALLRVWTTVLLGNALGCLVGALLLLGAEGVVQASVGYAAVASHFLGYGYGSTFMSAMLAGWLMALGGWLVVSSPPSLNQLLAIYIVTFTIGFAGLHHAIAGMAEVFTAAITGADVAAGRAAGVIAAVVGGNLVGGVVFVALLNYGHIRKADERAGSELG